MGRVKRPYGSWSRSMLEELRAAGELKVDAFLSWLAAKQIRIDRTLVSHWEAGRSHLPADLLPCLAQFTNRPDLVFGPFVREVGCEVVRIPGGEPTEADLLERTLSVGAALGRLQQRVLAARAAESPGGRAITEEERRALDRTIEKLIQQLADLKAELKGS